METYGAIITITGDSTWRPPMATEETCVDVRLLWDYQAPLTANEDSSVVRAKATEGNTTRTVSIPSVLSCILAAIACGLLLLVLKTGKRNKAISESANGTINELLKAVNELKVSHEILAQKGREAEDLKSKSRGVLDCQEQDMQTEKKAQRHTLPDKISYDAAVDAWIFINNHLFTLGRDRFKIPHVYAFLGGYPVETSELKADLDSLNLERREEVNTILGDIKQFKVQHLSVIEAWLSHQSGDIRKLRDAVRFPIGQPFDNELDEHLLGDTVKDGETISSVASLGYLFPGSLNGCYRVKSKVLVEFD